MGDPYAPPLARFPDVRLQRAGVSTDDHDRLRAAFDAAPPDRKRDLVLTVAAVSDGDLTGEDGALGEVLAGWLGDEPDTGYDPTAHNVPEVETYLDGVTDVAEVDRVEAAEKARTDREPRVGVISACQDARERITAGD